MFISEETHELINGAIDIHMHGSPDIVPRIATDLQLARQAAEVGMKAIMVKSHVTPTATRAQLVQEALADSIQVYGGLTLNAPAGGLNPHAVEAELKLGAKQIWMPTISAENQARLGGHGGKNSVPVFDDNNKILPQAHDILDLIAKYDAILGTGHLSAAECSNLVPIAKQHGVRKIIITHPESRLIEMPIDMQQKLAKQGVFFERCFYRVAIAPPANITPELFLQQIQSTGAEQTIISTDFGQTFNDTPVRGLQKCIQTLLNLNVAAKEISLMIKSNPASLLGI